MEQDVAASSGTYSYGHATVTRNLPREIYVSTRHGSNFSDLEFYIAGEYTVVLSSFDPAHQGRFSLHAQSSLRNSLALIPQEGAGMYTKTVRGEWYVSQIDCAGSSRGNCHLLRTKETAGGPHNHNRYLSNPQYELHLSFPTEIKYVRHYTSDSLRN